MSQSGPGPNPTSPPNTEGIPSQPSHESDHQARVALSAEGPSAEGGRVPVTNGDRQQQGPSHRSWDVTRMLNPAEVQAPSTANPGRGEQVHGPGGHQGYSVSGQGQYGSETPRPYIFQGSNPSHHHQQQQQGLPVPTGDAPAAGPASVPRTSPTSMQPYPGLVPPRRLLTPRSPRASSMGHAPPPRAYTTQPQPYAPPGPPTGGRGYPGDAPTPARVDRSPQSRPAQPAGLNAPGVAPPTSMAALATPPRSVSQPIIGPYATAQEQQPRQPPFANSPYAPGIPPVNRGYPPPLPSGDSRWSSSGFGGGQGPQRVKSVGASEGGQHVITIHPSHGEELYVPVDVHQASRQADEKRLRNAGASARFRARKKEREREQNIGMQKLEAQSRDLEKRIRDLEGERDHYRSDRDRLRDLVYRTPSISEMAYQGPPSPTSTRSGGSFAEPSPLAGVPPPPALPMPGYGAADPLTGERSSRRRRTDPQVEFSIPSYTPTAASLPPMQPQVYGGPLSQPGTPSAVGPTARLPPLRMDQPAGASGTEAPSAMPTTSTYSPYKREPYESGWATRPSGPPDPGPR